MMLTRSKRMLALLKETLGQWWARDPFRNSTVIAYYTIFSLPGLLVIIINLAGYFFEQQAVTNKISEQVQGMIGSDTARDVEAIIANASKSQGFTLASIMGIATLLFGATGVFYQLQQTLNMMWGVKAQPKRMIDHKINDGPGFFFWSHSCGGFFVAGIPGALRQFKYPG